MPSHFADSWKDVIELVVLAGGMLLALVQLRLLLWQLRDQQDQAQEQNQRERRRQTLEIDARITKYTEQRSYIEKIFSPSVHRSPVSIENILKQFDEHEELEENLIVMLTQFETLALPVCADVADEDMAFELIGLSMVWFAITFREYIEYKNKKENRTDLFCYLIYLSARWAKRSENGYTLMYKFG